MENSATNIKEEIVSQNYLTDSRLSQVYAVLFEMANNSNIDPNRSKLAFKYHNLLATEGFEYKSILLGDELSQYCADAFELCSTSTNMSCEEMRDEIRSDLSEVIKYAPKLRSYPDGYFDDEC